MSEQETPEPVVAHGGELEEVKELVRKHGTIVLFGMCIVVAGVVAVTMLRNQRVRRLERASIMLSTVRSIQELETLVADYAATPVAPLALLRLAKAHYDASNYDVALAKYDAFKATHATHDFADAAEIGRLHCFEARGQLAEALAGFQAFADASPQHYLAPQAIFGQARSLAAMGQLDEARTTYEDFIANHPDSTWLAEAESLLEAINERIRKGNAPAMNAAATAPIITPSFETPAAE